MNEQILGTTICSVEEILNQRPLTPVSDDTESLEAITPNHFLIESSGSKMIRIYSKEYKTHHRNLKEAETNASQIKSGKYFKREYNLMHLIRSKLFKESKIDLNEVNLVWIVDPQTFTNKFQCLKNSEIKLE